MSEPSTHMIVRGKPRTADQNSRLLIGILVASGAAAMGHETLWTRRMADLLGANVEATTRVFGCSFLGLSLGAAVAATIFSRVNRPWRLAGLIEFAVGASSMLIVWLPEWSRSLWPMFGPEKLAGWQGALVKSSLSFLLIVPPAALIGMTLPLVAAAARNESAPSYSELFLYSCYTVGGVAGLGLLGCSLLPVAGARGAMSLMVSINLVTGWLCLRKDARAIQPRAQSDAQPPPAAELTGGEVDWMRLGVSFFSGFGIVSLEVLGLALILLAAPVSFYPQLTILLAVVLLLSGSSFIAARTARSPRTRNRLFLCSLSLPGPAIVLVPFLFVHSSGVRIGKLGFIGTFSVDLLGATLLILAPAFLAAGLVFPVLLSQINSRSGITRHSGLHFARLLAVNGLGGMLGAKVCYSWLLPCLGVHVAIGVIAVLYGFVGVLIAWRSSVSNGMRSVLAISSAGVAAATILGLTRLPLFFQSGGGEVLEVRSGPEGSLALVANKSFGRALIFNSQYLLGSSGAKADEERQAHIALLLHPNPKRVAFIGLGTGITAGGSLLHESVESVTAVELSSLVAHAAATAFCDDNHDICHNKKVKVLVEDARIFLSASQNQFDVIVGDLFTPWRPGEAGICTLEQFVAAYRALRPGGVFCQWLPLHQLTPDQLELIVATFQHVFPDASLFRNSFRVKSLPVALIGFKAAKLDWSVIRESCARVRASGRIVDPLVRHAEGLALLYLGPAPVANSDSGYVNTLANLRLELDASLRFIAGNARERFSGEGKNWRSFLQAQIFSHGCPDEQLPQSLRRLPAIGFLASQVEMTVGNERERLRAQLEASLPAEILADRGSDWSFWPGSPPAGSARATAQIEALKEETD